MYDLIFFKRLIPTYNDNKMENRDFADFFFLGGGRTLHDKIQIKKGRDGQRNWKRHIIYI
jgi:hypothetical protein